MVQTSLLSKKSLNFIFNNDFRILYVLEYMHYHTD